MRVRLNITIETFTCYHRLPNVLIALQRDYPHVELRIATQATQKPLINRIVKLLRSNPSPFVRVAETPLTT